MDSGFEQLSVVFSTKAQKLFISTYEKFRLSTKKLDRLKDENVFQLQAGKFLSILKLQLEQIAHELLYKNNAVKNTDQFGMILKSKIKVYLMEFREKARLL